MGANRNFTHNSNFFFGTNLFGEETLYAIQECNLPGMSFSHIQVSKSAVFGNITGDTPTYNDLTVSLIIDEKLEIWKQIIGTLQEMRDPTNAAGETVEKMGWLEIHDDNTNLVLKLEFTGMMVENIDDLAYNTNADDEIITCAVNLKYDYYTIT